MNFIIKSSVNVLIATQIDKIFKQIEESGAVEKIVYNCEETSLAEILEDANTFPMWSDYKLIVMSNANFLNSKGINSEFENDYEDLENYLKHKNNFSVLVFVTEDIDNRKKLVKSIRKNSTEFDLDKVDNSKIEQVIMSKLSKGNKVISNELAKEICHKLNYDLALIYNETDKLLLVTNDTITKKDVDSLITKTLEDNIFELTNAIVDKNAAKGYEVYKDLVQLKEDPVKLVAVVASQIRLLIQVKGYSEERFSSKEIASKLRIHPYRCDLAFKSAKRFKMNELENLLSKLATTDYEIKSGKLDKNIGLELFILSINGDSI